MLGVPETFLRATSFALLALAFAAPPSPAHAQVDDDLRHFTLSTWTTGQGLPQNFITAIDQTPDGFLWIGTRGGLARFDGVNFRSSFANEPAAIHSSVNAVVHDHAGRLWVATTLGLLCEVHGIWTQVPLPVGAPAQPGGMVVAHDGRLVVSISDSVWWLDPATRHFTRIQGTPTKLRGFDEDSHGDLWLTDSEAVTRLESGGKSTRYPLHEAGLVEVAGDGKVYVGDGHHLFCFNGAGFEPVKDPGTEEFVDMKIAHDGALWLAAGGLEGLSRKTASGVQRFSMHDGLASNDVRTLYEDRDGAMWVGTISGLQRLRRGSFASYPNEGLPPSTAQYDAIFEAADQSIWTGTLQEGVSVFRNGTWKTYGPEAGVRRGQVRGFIEDGPMPMIAIADYGLFRWNGSRYVNVPGVPPGYVSSPVRATDGSAWFTIFRQGIFRMNAGKFQTFGKEQGLVDPRILCVLPDHGGGVYAGASSGIFHYVNGAWKREFPALHDAVLSLAFGSPGEMLAGTSTGLVIVSSAGVKTIGRAQGLLSEPVLQVTEDRDGGVWVATAAGLSRIARSQMQAFVSGQLSVVTPELYTEEDGLPGRDLLPANQVLGLRARDGKLWFAMTRGPASGNALPEVPPTALFDGIAIDGNVQPDDVLRVAPGRHRVTFAFTAPSFDAPEMIRFRYRLVGWDTAWVDAGKQREATYAGLPPGKYSFEMQAIGRGGLAGPIARIPSIELMPFFWQTRWFIALASLLGAALIIEFTRRRTMLRARRLSLLLQERAAERERIAYLIHDTVIQDLIGATLYLEIAEMELAAGELDPSKPLEGLAARLRESIARSRSMVANLHATATPEHGLLDVLRLAEAEFRLAAEPAFRVSYTGEPRAIDPLLRDEVYRVCREAIANAFRHAHAHLIHVHAEFEPRSLVVEIADDGIGMEQALLQTGREGHFGLHAMRSHTERIAAELTIESAPKKGTVIRLRTRSSSQTRVWSWLRERAQRWRSRSMQSSS